MTREQWERIIDLLACGDPWNPIAFRRWYNMRAHLWAHNQIDQLNWWDRLRRSVKEAAWRR